MRGLAVVMGMVACGGVEQAAPSDAGTPARDPNARAWALVIESFADGIHCEGATTLVQGTDEHGLPAPYLSGLWTGQCSGSYSWSGADWVYLDYFDQHFSIGVGNRNVVFCSAVAQTPGSSMEASLCTGSGHNWEVHAKPPPGS